jgi:hypothetical protein
MSRIYHNITETINNAPPVRLNRTAQKRGAAAGVPLKGPNFSTRGQFVFHRLKICRLRKWSGATLTKNLRGLTGSPEVLRRRTKHNRVIANETAGKNLARFRPSTDLAGICGLLGQAALSHASHRRVFSSFAKTKPQPKKS